MRSGRVVIVDPAYASSVGHHGDVNAQLLTALAADGWAAECWADGEVAANGCRGVFSGCGYVDPRHWADLGGMVHLARRLEQQLLEALEGQVVGAWVMHTALPFQLLGLARALRQCPAAAVVVSLMFAPGETLEGDGNEGAAAGSCQVALSALARAVEQGGHRLQLRLPSRQSQEIYAPLLAAAGLGEADLHPAVVGAGLTITAETEEPPAPGTRPRILLHWGDLKAGKGRREALEVVQQLLGGGPLPASLQQAEWLFQLHSHDPLPADERTCLDQAREQINGFQWLNERVETRRMQALLAGCDAALLAYDPVLYRQRSSGLLWCYGAARVSRGRPAAVVGRAGGWLEREARDLGLGWRSGRDGQWLKDLAAAVAESRAGDDCANEGFTPYGQRMLGEGFASHVAGLLRDLRAPQGQTIERG